MIAGISHLTFAVSDPAASTRFYSDVLGLRLVAKWPRGAYLLAGDTWIALVQDDAVKAPSIPDYSHVAFAVTPAQFEEASRRVLDSGARIWKSNESEGDSLYFEDPDGHRLELHVGDLASRLAAARENPWPGLEIVDEPPSGKRLAD